MPVTRFQANLLLVAVAAIWGSAFVAQSFAGAAGLALLYNGASFTLAGLILWPAARTRGRADRAQWLWMAAAGALLFGGSALQQLGLFYTKVANASFLTSLYVIFTPFLLWAGYRERPAPLHALAAALALGGAFLLSMAGGPLVWQTGDALETLGALFWGLHLILVGKYATRFDALSFATGQFLVCGALNFACGFWLEPAPALLQPPVLAAIAYRSLLSIAIGYTAQVWAQKFTSPTEAALIFALESVFAAVAAAAVLHEHLLAPQILGCLLILAAAGMSQVVPVKSCKPVP